MGIYNTRSLVAAVPLSATLSGQQAGAVGVRDATSLEHDRLQAMMLSSQAQTRARAYAIGLDSGGGTHWALMTGRL